MLQWAFTGCGFLTSITLPDNIVTFGSEIFENCDNLSEIEVKKIALLMISLGAQIKFPCSITALRGFDTKHTDEPIVRTSGNNNWQQYRFFFTLSSEASNQAARETSRAFFYPKKNSRCTKNQNTSAVIRVVPGSSRCNSYHNRTYPNRWPMCSCISSSVQGTTHKLFLCSRYAKENKCRYGPWILGIAVIVLYLFLCS